MPDDDHMSGDIQDMAHEASKTRRQEMANKAAEVSEALETEALFEDQERPSYDGREWHPELRQKARQVAAYLKEQAE